MVASLTLAANRKRLLWDELFVLLERVEVVLRTLRARQCVDIDLIPATTKACTKLDGVKQKYSDKSAMWRMFFGSSEEELFRGCANDICDASGYVVDVIDELKKINPGMF
jgi:hypothetical protein